MFEAPLLKKISYFLFVPTVLIAVHQSDRRNPNSLFYQGLNFWL